jgi:hypothetical protein
MRHYCRNPRCKMKLAEPVDTERRAFCTPGCHASFYKSRCVVCEKDLPKGPANRRLCKSVKCRAEYQRFPHLFVVAERNPGKDTGNRKRPSKTSIKTGSFWCDKEGREWRWEQFGDEHWLFNRDEDVQARLIPAGDLYIVRLSPGIDYGRLPLDDAKRQAISLSLGRLPLEPKYAERLAKINELPPDPPQNLVPWCADYLAGLAELDAESPSIVPDDTPRQSRHSVLSTEGSRMTTLTLKGTLGLAEKAQRLQHALHEERCRRKAAEERIRELEAQLKLKT